MSLLLLLKIVARCLVFDFNESTRLFYANVSSEVEN